MPTGRMPSNSSHIPATTRSIGSRGATYSEGRAGRAWLMEGCGSGKCCVSPVSPGAPACCSNACRSRVETRTCGKSDCRIRQKAPTPSEQVMPCFRSSSRRFCRSAGTCVVTAIPTSFQVSQLIDSVRPLVRIARSRANVSRNALAAQ